MCIWLLERVLQSDPDLALRERAHQILREYIEKKLNDVRESSCAIGVLEKHGDSSDLPTIRIGGRLLVLRRPFERLLDGEPERNPRKNAASAS